MDGGENTASDGTATLLNQPKLRLNHVLVIVFEKLHP
jgi:hypothetical protein